MKNKNSLAVLAIALMATTMISQAVLASPSGPPPASNLTDAKFNSVAVELISTFKKGLTILDGGVDATGTTNGVIGRASSGIFGAAGVEGINSAGVGVLGMSATVSAPAIPLTGVYGYAPTGDGVGASGLVGVRATGTNNGVAATSATGSAISAISSSGIGVSASSTSSNGVLATSTSGAALYGNSTNNDGVLGISNSATGHGVYGNGLAGGYGVMGISTTGYGVYGNSTAGGDGVAGGATSGHAIYGGATTGWGVYGTATSGRGVLGSSTTGTGVQGVSTSNTAVYGITTSGTAGSFFNNTLGGQVDLATNTNAINASGNVNINDGASGKGITLNAADRPLITRGWDAFTSGKFLGNGRWGVFMEPTFLTLGIPWTDVGVRGMKISAYKLDSTKVDLMTVDNSGNATFTNDITIGGHLKGAAGIGTYANGASLTLPIPASTAVDFNSNAASTPTILTCPVGQVAVSCNFAASSGACPLGVVNRNAVYPTYQSITPMGVASGTCSMTLFNKTAGAVCGQVSLKCWDPNG